MPIGKWSPSGPASSPNAAHADDVPGGEDVGHRGPVPRIDPHAAPGVGREPGRGQVQRLGGGDASRREEDHVRHDPLAGLEGQHRPPRGLLADGQRGHRLAEAESDVAVAHLVHELVHDLAVDELQHSLAPLDQGHVHPHRREDRRVLDADHAGADDGEAAGQVGELHDVVRRQNDLAVGRHARRGRGLGAHRDHHVGGGDATRAGLALDLERVGVDEPRGAGEHGHVVAPQLVFDHLDLAADDVVDAGEELWQDGRASSRAQGRRSALPAIVV